MSRAQCSRYAELEKAASDAEADLFGVLQSLEFQHQDDLPAFNNNADCYREQIFLRRSELAAHMAECCVCKDDGTIAAC